VLESDKGTDNFHLVGFWNAIILDDESKKQTDYGFRNTPLLFQADMLNYMILFTEEFHSFLYSFLHDFIRIFSWNR
jgi:hypothetical protein